MKTRYLILTSLVLMNCLLLTRVNFAQETKVEAAKEKVKDAKLELKVAQAQNDKEWRQFKVVADSQISANEKSITELKEKIKTSDEKFKVKYDKKVAALEEKNIELKKKISEYKYEGKDKWEEFKKGFNRDVDIVGNALKDIFAKKD